MISLLTSSRRPCARPTVAALLLVLLVAVGAPAGAAADPMYWGGTIKGDVYGVPGEAPTSPAVLERFEADAGKKVTFVNTGQSWASFDRPTMDAAIAAGALPLVTMRLEGATLKEVVEGRQDARIEAWARAAKAFGYPFLFRPWWEVNGAWYSWGRSPEYVAAWRHFHDVVVKRVGATNVTWAWVVNAIWEDPESKPGRWYPGDEYVDWVGMDAYNWGKNPIQPARWLTAEESIQPTLAELEAIAPGKPVCICESASTEYGEEGANQSKADWIHEMLDSYLPSHPSIKAYLWFNWNVEKEGGPVGERYDWPIESSSTAEAAFREGIADPDYLSQLPPLTRLAKVPMPALASPAEATPTGGSVAAPTVVPAPTASTAPAPATGGSTNRAPAPAVERIAFGAPRAASSGTAKLPLWIPSAGDLLISARGGRIDILPAVGPARRTIPRSVPARERFMLEVSPDPSSRARGGPTKVTILVRFTPSGGSPSLRRLTFTLPAQS